MCDRHTRLVLPDGAKRERTDAILAILEEKRNAVMTQTEAGYFIRDWQDISDQVRQIIVKDPRLHALNFGRGAKGDQPT
jgi:hypothetical protein